MIPSTRQDITHVDSISVGDLNDPTSKGSGQTHGLGTLISLGVFPSPIHYPHAHEVVQDPISEDCRIAGTELFDNTDGISP